MPGNELYAYADDVYRTRPRHLSWIASTFPSLSFYRKFFWYVYQSSVLARRGGYDGPAWSQSSRRVLEVLESVGVIVEISGVQHIRDLTTPCVFVGNHMSTLETIILPSIIQPVRPVTFVVKKSLLEYPVFRHVVGSRDPIAVSREDPRADLKSVMQGGMERLEKGISIVVFPQTTRAATFDASQFNTIGVKLALRAGVPVIPIALVTDAWGNGKRIKDFGRIDTTKAVRIAFGEPIVMQDRGSKQHQQIIDFIEGKLKAWDRLPARQ